MRVLITFPHPFPGGSALAGRHEKYSRGLRAAGADVRILGQAGVGKQPVSDGWAADPHGNLYMTAPLARRSFFIKVAQRLLPTVNPSVGLYLDTFRRVLDSEQFDVVIFDGRSWSNMRTVLAECRRRRIPVVALCSEWFPCTLSRIYGTIYLEQVLFMWRVLPKVSAIMGVSSLWDEWASRRGMPFIRSATVCEDSAPQPRWLEGADHQYTVVYVGNMEWRDLPGTMLESVRLAAESGLNVRLVVVGNMDLYPEGRKARKYAQNHPKLKDRVEFTGFVSDVELVRISAEADALLLIRPECREVRACFPTRLPEYLLTGKPVIISDVSDMKQYFQHRSNAWLLPPGHHPRELANAMIHLASHNQEARAIGLAGQQTAVQEFSYLKHGRELLRFLERIRDVCAASTK